MIIKSHIRGGYRAAADYLKEYNKNEHIRLVQISDPDARNLDEAFHNMWTVASTTKATKPLHHISINPYKDERLTDKQVLKIVKRCEEKYGYKPDCHQRVIVEHVLNGRQHFHVMWNRVSLDSGRAIWPGQHWNKSKQAAREMEQELGFKTPVPRRVKRMRAAAASRGRKAVDHYNNLNKPIKLVRPIKIAGKTAKPEEKVSTPIRPATPSKGWPEAAIIDWETWGHLDTARFFRLWSELASPGFSPSG